MRVSVVPLSVIKKSCFSAALFTRLIQGYCTLTGQMLTIACPCQMHWMSGLVRPSMISTVMVSPALTQNSRLSEFWPLITARTRFPERTTARTPIDPQSELVRHARKQPSSLTVTEFTLPSKQAPEHALRIELSQHCANASDVPKAVAATIASIESNFFIFWVGLGLRVQYRPKCTPVSTLCLINVLLSPHKRVVLLFKPDAGRSHVSCVNLHVLIQCIKLLLNALQQGFMIATG